jgi:hypothetical protein
VQHSTRFHQHQSHSHIKKFNDSSSNWS